MGDVRVIGDEVFYQDYLVAVLVDRAPNMQTLHEFALHLDNATLFEDEDQPKTQDEINDACTKPHVNGEGEPYEDALNDVAFEAKKLMRGGLLRSADLAKLLQRLRKDPEVETPAS